MSEVKTNIAIYARVSKDEAAESERYQDPANQIQPLKQLCVAMNWPIRDDYIFIDRASGGSANRPEFQRMLSEVRQRHIDLILVWALDRFSREGMVNTLKYIQTLKQYKCGIKSLQESWLDTSQEGVADLLLAIFSWVAEQERLRISQRTKAGIIAKKKAGLYTGGRPRKGGLNNGV